jgi:hypothetical protein
MSLLLFFCNKHFLKIGAISTTPGHKSIKDISCPSFKWAKKFLNVFLIQLIVFSFDQWKLKQIWSQNYLNNWLDMTTKLGARKKILPS